MKVLNRLGILICCGTIVFLILLYVSIQPKCVKTTLGNIAEKNADFEGCRITITNAILGEKAGPFIRFKSTVDSRYDVVLMSKEPITGDCFRCYCVGLMTERVMGCPFDPPFVFLIDGVPTHPDRDRPSP